MKRFLSTLLIGSSLLCVSSSFSPSFAQTSSQLADRLDRLERDLSYIQRQYYQGGGSTSGGSASGDTSGSGAARLEVKLSQLEEQLRALTGKIEEVDFANRRLKQELDALSKDIEFRFQSLESNRAPATPPVSSGAGVMSPEASNAPVEEQPAAMPATSSEMVRGEPKDLVSSTAQGQVDSTTLYNQAFSLLNQARYDEAALSLKEFTLSYPEDPLIGNAFYWLGETYYVKKEYLAAADYFRQGYEKLPTGPKAADNLLKLGMSLGALGKQAEACVVLGQVQKQFPKASSSISQNVANEKSKLNCQ